MEGDELLSRKIFPLDRRIESGGSNYKHIIIQTIENGNVYNEMYISTSEFHNACWALREAEEDVISLRASLQDLKEKTLPPQS